jgi:hypothetical protein
MASTRMLAFRSGCVSTTQWEADMTITPITNTGGNTFPQGPQGVDIKQRMQPVADLFHESSDQLMSELQSGKSLAELAQEKGVSQQDLLNAVKQGLTTNAPAGTDPSKLDAIANQIINHVPGKGGAHGHHHHHGGGSSTSSTSSTNSNLIVNGVSDPNSTNSVSGFDTLA